MKLRSYEDMTEADVCSVNTNLPATELYESVGFQLTKRLLIFKKRK